MEQAADAIIQAANEIASLSELAGGDPDPETSSSLSEMEYKDSHMEDEGELSDVANSQSEEDNDSEAETERLEESPNKIRAHKDIVLNQSNLDADDSTNDSCNDQHTASRPTTHYDSSTNNSAPAPNNCDLVSNDCNINIGQW